MATYRQYAKANGHTDQQIEKNAGGLFDVDQELEIDKNDELTGSYPDRVTYRVSYDMYLNCNNSACDTVEQIDDETGDIIEEWRLDY